MTKLKTGVIEGFYGIPWTYDERISMIEFLADMDMNEFIYAPKDDPYHNEKWRELYPAEKLSELERLAAISDDNGIEFVWAIHPGQNLIKFEDYENEVAKIYNKYDQLHEAGVKSFALCLDDIDLNQAYEDRDYHLRLVKDLIKHISKYENKELLFVHPWYNSDWIDDKGTEYFDMFRDVDNVNIMWTGYDVVAPVRYEANEKFIELLGKKPHIWFNWPVNDYKRDQIFMEIFEFYDSTDFNYDSFVLNPMNQAELSKIAIFQAAEFFKDPTNYEPIESFKKALAYVDEKAAADLFAIADSFFGSDIYKREDNKKYTEDMAIAKAYEAGDLKETVRLIDEKIAAIESYKVNHDNKLLYEEVEPFFEGLHYLLQAIKVVTTTGDFTMAEELYAKSKECKVRTYKDHSTEIEDRVVKTSETLENIYWKQI